MLENEVTVKENTELDTTTEVTDDELVTLDTSANTIVKKIIQEKNADEMQELIKAFNLNQSKKNLVRLLQLNGLYDKTVEVAIDRFTNHSDEIPNKEVLDYLTAIQNSIEKTQKTINGSDMSGVIQITDNHTEVNIDTAESLSKESRDRILSVVAAVLQKSGAIEKK